MNKDLKEAFLSVLWKLELYRGRLDLKGFWDEGCEVNKKLQYHIRLFPDED